MNVRPFAFGKLYSQIPPLQRNLLLGGLTLGTILPILVLTWVRRLESIGCTCSDDWRRTFLKGYAIYHVTLIAVSIALLLIFRRFFAISGVIAWVLAIVYVVSALQYIHRLKKEKCACSEDVRREITWIVAWIQAGLLAFSVLLILFTVGWILAMRS
jgi:hypothetical protein